MKRIGFSFVIAAVLVLMTSCNNSAKNAKLLTQLAENDVKISRIDPTDWYVGLKDPTLQLMVYGQGIREA